MQRGQWPVEGNGMTRSERDGREVRAAARVEFCGEVHPLRPDTAFTIGRDADLSVDDNPHLDRVFLLLEHDRGLWWVANVGTRLSATIADAHGRFLAWANPGTCLPLAFDEAAIRFGAGPTTYEVTVHTAGPYGATIPGVTPPPAGEVASLPVSLTEDQHLLLVAMAEPTLRGQQSRAALPSSASVAARLGWPVTTLNRKLDTMCAKLERSGVEGLHGRRGQLAGDRRARLVEYAMATRTVTTADLGLLGARSGDRSRDEQAGS